MRKILDAAFTKFGEHVFAVSMIVLGLIALQMCR